MDLLLYLYFILISDSKHFSFSALYYSLHIRNNFTEL